MILIPRNISDKVVMTGVYYKNNHPGGISAVVQYWSQYVENLQYFPMFKEGNALCKIWYFLNSMIRLFCKLLLDKNVQIVHVHTAADTDFKRSGMVLWLSKAMGRKVILHSHASRFKDYYAEANEKEKSWIVSTINKADVLIVLSESWKTWFASIGVVKEKIVILHNITAYPAINENVQEEKRRNIERPIRFLFLGEIGKRKGVFDIIKAFANHKETLTGKAMLRIGGNKNEDVLISAINDNELSDIVKFEGFVSGKVKIELLNWADVYILPSYNEGLPISILEAMSYGMPIITTPVGGIPEIVDNTNGILVEPGDEEAIFGAMCHYVHNRNAIQDQGQISKRKAQEYLPDFVLSHLKSIYNSLIYQEIIF